MPGTWLNSVEMTDIQTSFDAKRSASADQTESIDPFELIPTFVRRCLYIGSDPDWLSRRSAEGIEELWCASEPKIAQTRFSPGYFDAVLVAALPDTVDHIREWLVSLAGLMDENGLLSLRLR